MPKLILACLCLTLISPLAALAGDMLVYFGTHAAGPDRGFSIAHFDPATGAMGAPQFILASSAPAYFVVAPDGKHLYTCNSGDTFLGQPGGGVSAYSIDSGTGQLKLLNQKSSEGEDPSYISLDQTAHFALVANYKGGNIIVYNIAPDGSLGAKAAFVQHTGSSVDPVRQTHAYAHSIVVDPTNHFALVADLGLDKVFVYRFNAKDGSLEANDPPFAAIKPGSGPRHVVFHPNGHFVYVINEIASTVVAFEWDSSKGTLREVQNISALPEDFKGVSTCAEIRIHPNGRFLYASNRGHDSVAVLGIDPESGRLTLVQHISSGGKTPRNFAMDPTAHWMIVTNHGSNNAVVFSVDEQSGKLAQVGAPVAANYPFCPRFLSLPVGQK